MQCIQENSRMKQMMVRQHNSVISMGLFIITYCSSGFSVVVINILKLQFIYSSKIQLIVLGKSR